MFFQKSEFNGNTWKQHRVKHAWSAEREIELISETNGELMCEE